MPRNTLEAAIERVRVLAHERSQRPPSPGALRSISTMSTIEMTETTGSTMPRNAAPENPTPFGQLLLEYMDRNRASKWGPPMTTGQLAVKLKTSRQTIHNWTYKAQTPILETILSVLLELNIPLNDLLERYQAAGTPLPAVFDMPSTHTHTATQTATTPTQPSAGLSGGLPAGLPTQQPPRLRDTPAPRPYVAPARAADAAAADATALRRLEQQTIAAMRSAGMSDSGIATVLANLRATIASDPGEPPLRQHIIAEHSEPAEPVSTSGEASAEAAGATSGEATGTGEPAPTTSAQQQPSSKRHTRP